MPKAASSPPRARATASPRSPSSILLRRRASALPTAFLFALADTVQHLHPPEDVLRLAVGQASHVRLSHHGEVEEAHAVLRSVLVPLDRLPQRIPHPPVGR